MQLVRLQLIFAPALVIIYTLLSNVDAQLEALAGLAGGLGGLGGMAGGLGGLAGGLGSLTDLAATAEQGIGSLHELAGMGQGLAGMLGGQDDDYDEGQMQPVMDRRAPQQRPNYNEDDDDDDDDDDEHKKKKKHEKKDKKHKDDDKDDDGEADDGDEDKGDKDDKDDADPVGRRRRKRFAAVDGDKVRVGFLSPKLLVGSPHEAKDQGAFPTGSLAKGQNHGKPSVLLVSLRH